MLHLIGIDWSEDNHVVRIITEDGRLVDAFTIDHGHDGFLRLEHERAKLGVLASECLVAIETAHNLLVDFLWDHGYRVCVIPPKVVDRCRNRFSQSDAKDDGRDARILADILRTDRALHPAWEPDSLLVRQIRAKVDLAMQIGRTIVRQTNQLRSVLLRYYPHVLGLFSDLQSQISLSFIAAYPTPQAAQSLTLEEFQAFAKANHYHKPKSLPKAYARLRRENIPVQPEVASIYQGQAQLLARLTLPMVQARAQVLRDLSQQFAAHDDYELFQSLPGAGEFLAPALLSVFGDRRERYPSPEIVQALAGTCPVTEQSGKKRVVRFRRSCNHDNRWILQQFARCSIPECVWAAAYYEEVKLRGNSDNHAYRCLANRWIPIIWKMWQEHKPYDEGRHMRDRDTRAQARTKS